MNLEETIAPNTFFLRARPCGRMGGVATIGDDLVVDALERLKEVLPKHFSSVTCTLQRHPYILRMAPAYHHT